MLADRISNAFVLILSLNIGLVQSALHVVIPGGTGKMGRLLSQELVEKGHDVTILSRNTFLASTPARVSGDYGWLGEAFVNKYKGDVTLRDWDGGDLLDIVGCDWMGWQDDIFSSPKKKVDFIVHLVGGYTDQRVMACERIIRECISYNQIVSTHHISLSPVDSDLTPIKLKRVTKCEDMIKTNCPTHKCLRAEINDYAGAIKNIMQIIDDN